MDKNDKNRHMRNMSITFDAREESSFLNKLISLIGAKLVSLAEGKRQYKSVFSERVVEYPLVFEYLTKMKKDVNEILDFGCVENILPIYLCSLGYEVTGMDQRDYPFEHPNFNFIKANILDLEPDKGRYDFIISISTIEHVGVGTHFGLDMDSEKKGTDKIAIKKLLALLKKEGKIMLSVPFGKYCVKRNQRIYNYQKLHDLIPNIKTERFFVRDGRYGSWKEVEWQEINNLEYEDYYATSPTQGIAFVIARKT